MRLIKLAFLSFIVLFGILTAMSLLIPGRVRISRAINLKTFEDSLMHLVGHTEQWQRWHPAFEGNVAPSKILADNGISLSTLVANDSLVQMQWQQEGRRPVIHAWALHRYPHTDSLTLQWYMDFRLRWYPWQKFSSLFYEGTYGKMMENGLMNLEKISHRKD